MRYVLGKNESFGKFDRKLMEMEGKFERNKEELEKRLLDTTAMARKGSRHCPRPNLFRDFKELFVIE